MDKRSLLLGLGMGMVIGVLLMQLFIMGENSTKQLTEIDTTINVPAIESSPIIVNDESDISLESELKETEPQQNPVDSATTVEEELHSNEEGEFSNEEGFPKTLLLRVLGGATVSQIGEVLEKYKVIESRDDFTKYIRSKRMHTKLRAGYFYVIEQSTNDEILNILTSEPLSEEVALEVVQLNEYTMIVSPEN